MTVRLAGGVLVEHDDAGNVRYVEHPNEPFAGTVSRVTTRQTGATAIRSDLAAALSLADEYLGEVAPLYGISETMLPQSQDPGETRLFFAETKEVSGLATVSYQQFQEGVPVWAAGVSVTVLPDPLRVTASQSSVHFDVSLPPAGPPAGPARFRSENITAKVLSQLLGLAPSRDLTLNDTRELIYRYDSDRRLQPGALPEVGGACTVGHPTLTLPPLSADIVPGAHYRVVEALFTLQHETHGHVHWRVFLEERAGEVLYLRALTACAEGLVFRTDPLTAAGGVAPQPDANAHLLDPFRTRVELAGLSASEPQQLSGEFVRIVDMEEPGISAPTQVDPHEFFYHAPTREFAAVNAYFHCDWFFRYLEGMGFTRASYFTHTSFPIPVDACAIKDDVNAYADGNIRGNGPGKFRFGLAGGRFPAVGMAADVRVVLHEFGHALLWAAIQTGEFEFAHSPGDSLAAILLDPESALRSHPEARFATFPWGFKRQHGRKVTDGWGWGGNHDNGGYNSEQILSTTLFRFYCSIGGDSGEVAKRMLAARKSVYLIVKAIGALPSGHSVPTRHVIELAGKLQDADRATLDFEGYRGGTLHKVIRWSFEKQGLYQLTQSPHPVEQAGTPPDVDVYINDGRDGEYTYQGVYWRCEDIWNRLSESPDGGGVHETPITGQMNFLYVRVRNRGVRHASGVIVRGYTSSGGIGASWPEDWIPTDTRELPVTQGIGADAEVLVGPFRWMPSSASHAVLMEVSADRDLSNIDSRAAFVCASGPTPIEGLVPFDNNLALRVI